MSAPRLPTGVRDLPPEAAHQVFVVQQRLIEVMGRHGYHRVLTPSFDSPGELEATSHAAATPGDALIRFLDPDSGDVVALRSDVTPQVARLVARHLGSDSAPYRLCYSAVIYRPRARFGIAPRELIQAGAELIGAGGRRADLEMLGLAAACMEALELEDATLSIGHGGVQKTLLAAAEERLGEDVRAPLAEACRRKALGEVGRLCAAAPEVAAALDAILLAVGEVDAMRADGELRAALEAVPAAVAPFEELLDAAQAALDADIRLPIVVDLAAERGLDYYTGISFTALAAGTGRPVVTGGRYDRLLSRFGVDLPAIGFAVDERAVLEALGRRGRLPSLPPRDVLVVGDDAGADALVRRLRAAPAAISVIRSIAPDTWRDASAETLAALMVERRFRAVVFVDEGGATLVDAEGRRSAATLDEVAAAVLAGATT